MWHFPPFVLVGGGLRNTSVIVLTLESGEIYIVVSLSSRSDTQVIYVDPTTGGLCYFGKIGVDIFKSEREAVDFVTNGSKWLCKSTTYARAILGYAALGNFGMLLVATKLAPSISDLPGGGCVYTVMETQWIKISLQNPQALGKGEAKNILELMELDIDGKHYFCETRDMSRPFPSQKPLDQPDDEFVWNGWLSSPFKIIGLPQHCVILLQVWNNYCVVTLFYPCRELLNGFNIMWLMTKHMMIYQSFWVLACVLVVCDD